MPWNESNEVHTFDMHSGPTVVFAGDATSGGPPHYAPEVWHTIDLKPLGVSADAKFAEITGYLIITDLGSEIDNLTATFRPPGSTLDAGNYQMQVISVFSGDGQRQVQSVTVALVNGCFEFYWKKQVGGVSENGHPTAFLLNLWLSKWGRYEPAGSDQSEAIAAIQGRATALEASVASLLARVTALEASPPSAPTVIAVPPEGLTLQLVRE